MIGNDVVDLILAKKESNWKRKGFLDKIFTTFEQNLIENAPSQDEMVWMLWSVKESVYKAYQRLNFNEGFYPTKIKILNINGKNECLVQLFEIFFYAKTTFHAFYIHTIAVLNKTDFERVSIFENYNYVKNNLGLPVDLVSNVIMSVSHHGNIKKIVMFG